MSRLAVLTRPHPVSDGVEAFLRASGMAAVHVPVLDLAPAQVFALDASVLQACDGVVFVSQHACFFAQQQLEQYGLTWPKDAWLAGVGKASGVAIQSAWPSARVITPTDLDGIDSDGLWLALERAGLIAASKRVLVVRAQTGRDALLRRFESAGLRADVWACYRRAPAVIGADDLDLLARRLDDGGLIFSITSVEGLHSLVHQLLPSAAKFFGEPLVTLHPAIAVAAQALGFRRVFCVPPQAVGVKILSLRD